MDLVKYFFIGLALTAIPGSIFAITVSAKGVPEVSPTPSPTIEATGSPEPTEEPTPEPTPSPKPTPVPETPSPTPTVAPVTSEQIHGFIEKYAILYALDPNVLRHLAICESGFNPEAVNGSYVGLYQFGPITWQTYRAQMGEDPSVSRTDAEAAVKTTAYMLSIGKEKAWPNCNP